MSGPRYLGQHGANGGAKVLPASDQARGLIVPRSNSAPRTPHIRMDRTGKVTFDLPQPVFLVRQHDSELNRSTRVHLLYRSSACLTGRRSD
jgi:hypothetical protein